MVDTPLRDFVGLAHIGPLEIAIAPSEAAITAAALWTRDRRIRAEPLPGPLPGWMAQRIPNSIRADD